MQRRAPQARGDGSASSALRWALHHYVASAPCSTLETDARPEIRLRMPTPPGAPSPTTLAPPPIDAAPHLRPTFDAAPIAPRTLELTAKGLPKCSATAPLALSHPPGAHDVLFSRIVSIDGGLKIGVTQLS